MPKDTRSGLRDAIGESFADGTLFESRLGVNPLVDGKRPLVAVADVGALVGTPAAAQRQPAPVAGPKLALVET